MTNVRGHSAIVFFCTQHTFSTTHADVFFSFSTSNPTADQFLILVASFGSQRFYSRRLEIGKAEERGVRSLIIDMEKCAEGCSSCSVVYNPAAMQEALAEAALALAEAEVAVGCVFVNMASGEIVSRGRNETNRAQHALAHAEFVALQRILDLEEYTSSATRSCDLSGLCLYVTVEPCIMCAAMLLYHNIGHVFFGASNPRFGGNGTVLDLAKCGKYLAVSAEDGANRGGYCSEGGHEAEQAIKLLQSFYMMENTAAPESKRRRKEAT